MSFEKRVLGKISGREWQPATSVGSLKDQTHHPKQGRGSKQDATIINIQAVIDVHHNRFVTILDG
jgi:hypothetical protein